MWAIVLVLFVVIGGGIPLVATGPGFVEYLLAVLFAVSGAT